MSDLNEEQAENVRRALIHLRWRTGGWEPLAKALHYGSVKKVVNERRAVTPTLAFRVAAMLGSGVDDVLAGRALPHVCPNCGYMAEPVESESTATVVAIEKRKGGA